MARRHTLRAAIVLLLCAAVLLVCTVPAFGGLINKAAHSELVYFNDFNNGVDLNKADAEMQQVVKEETKNTRFNFGPDRYKYLVLKGAKTDEEVRDAAFKVETGAGDLIDSITKDPALCAAIALHLDESLNFDEKILVDEQNELIGRRADVAHKHFLDDQTYWDRAVSMITERLKLADVSVEKLDNYTSSMYMWHNHLDGNKPAVIVRNSTNAGGHGLVFDFGEKIGVVKFRLECGYQPIDVKYWEVPEGTDPVPDNPPSGEDPELEPKNSDAGPNAQIKDNKEKADFGGGPNTDIDKTVTDEPQSPSSYTPPAPPKSEDSDKKDDKTEDGSSATRSGSKTVDEDNGKTERHDGQDFEVVAGDGTTHTDLGEVQQQQSHDTVETPLQNDGVQQGDILPPE